MASDYDLFLNKMYSTGRIVDPRDVIDFDFLYNLHRWSKTSVKMDFSKKFLGESFEIYLGAILSLEDYPSTVRG